MQLDKFTNKARNIVAAAQGLAAQKDHQQIVPLHLLYAMIDDEEKIAGNIISSGYGDLNIIEVELEKELEKLPKISGSNQIYFSSETIKILKSASDLAKKSGDSFVTLERILESLFEDKVVAEIFSKSSSHKAKAKCLYNYFTQGKNGRY
ncbi:MAG UNVERIFIED_CONTAM: hypothetical protein LVQ98_03300 [Rickettsiaceae bacterium]|jgi:ATP-dependent Clp protease ATP-binding subunit ClpB